MKAICKNCKYWEEIIIYYKKDKVSGESFRYPSYLGKPKIDESKFALLSEGADEGRCSSKLVDKKVFENTTYGDGLTFKNNFGCIHFKDK